VLWTKEGGALPNQNKVAKKIIRRINYMLNRRWYQGYANGYGSDAIGAFAKDLKAYIRGLNRKPAKTK